MLPTKATAQYSNYTYDPTPPFMLSQQQLNEVVQRDVDREILDGQIYNGAKNSIISSQPTGIDTLPPPSSHSLTFLLSPSLRSKAYKAVVTEMRGVDPGSADRFSAMIDAGLIGQVEQGVEQLGLKKNDVADGLTFYWLAAWQAVYADGAIPDAATIQAVRQQSRFMLLQSADIGNAGATEKQKMTDSLFILALFVDVGFEQSKGDEKTLVAFKADTQQNAKKIGIDLASMTLTNEGFRASQNFVN